MGTMIACVAAAQLGVSTRTLARYADRGLLHAERTVGNWRLFDPLEVERFRKKLQRRRR